MSDVGLAAIAAVVVIGGLVYLANRFNDSEIRRSTRKHIRSMLERELGGLEVRGDVYEGTHQRVHVRVEGGWTPGTRVDAVVLTTSATLIGGQLAAFELEVPSSERSAGEWLARAGLASETLTRRLSFVAGGALTCDGVTIAVRTTKRYAVGDAIAVVAEIARAPERALSRLADAADVRVATVKDGTLLLGSDARPVTVTIDRGVRLSIDASPLEGLTAGSLGDAITALGRHARGPELAALASELTGKIEIDRRDDGDRLSLTIPLATPSDHVLRAAELVDRLTETERGPFR